MSGLTLRERAEEAVKAATDFEAENPADARSADDQKKFLELATNAGTLARELQNSLMADGSIAEANRILNGMGLDAGTPPADKQAKLSGESGIVKPRPGMTLGQVVAESPAYQEFVKNNSDAAGAIPDGWSGRAKIAELGGKGPRNTLVTTGETGDATIDANSGGFVEPTKLPGWVNEDPLAKPYLWDLCTKIPVTGEGFKYTRLVSTTNSAAFVAEATSADVLASDLSTGGVTDAAGGLKPESGLDWGQASGVVETVAHWIPITRQAAADAPQIVQIINTFLIDGLMVAIEEQILNGDGTSPNLRGLLNDTAPYANLISVDTSADAGGSRLNAVAIAIQQIHSARKGLFMPNAIVINTADFYSTDFLLNVDDNGLYRFGGPAAGSPGSIPLWGLQVVVSDEMDAGSQLVGDWRYALIADRQRAQLYVTDSHRDFFTRNLLVILAEQRMGFGVMAEQAFAEIVA